MVNNMRLIDQITLLSDFKSCVPTYKLFLKGKYSAGLMDLFLHLEIRDDEVHVDDNKNCFYD